MTEGSPFLPILDLKAELLTPVDAAEFPHALLRYRNDRAAAEVGLEGLSDAAWIKHFARFDPLPDNLSYPMAMAYHGHQFRVYNPQIGDGRGFLFAQLRDARGRLMDLGTKGSGQTPYSRSGDGRLTLKGAFREILATELLEALGVPTSRTFSVIETGERLYRNDEPSPTRSAVLVRLSHSHIRFGSFQRLNALQDKEGMAKLLAYSIRNFYPHLAEDDAPGFLAAVSQRMAVMTARMMTAGFVHGVLNTDNMNITGESFDYGPWRFAPTVDPNMTAAYFDHSGLYAFGRQPQAIYWNLAALAEALSLIAEAPLLEKKLEVFPEAYAPAFAEALLRRLGVKGQGKEEDEAFATEFFAFMNYVQLPFEQAFFDLFGGAAGREKRERSPSAAMYDGAAIIERLDAMEPDRPERLENPVFKGAPPTLIIEQVEALWEPVAQKDDWAPFEETCAAIRRYGAALDVTAAH